MRSCDIWLPLFDPSAFALFHAATGVILYTKSSMLGNLPDWLTVSIFPSLMVPSFDEFTCLTAVLLPVLLVLISVLSLSIAPDSANAFAAMESTINSASTSTPAFLFFMFFSSYSSLYLLCFFISIMRPARTGTIANAQMPKYD